jgi:hypothetical protein
VDIPQIISLVLGMACSIILLSASRPISSGTWLPLLSRCKMNFDPGPPAVRHQTAEQALMRLCTFLLAIIVYGPKINIG